MIVDSRFPNNINTMSSSADQFTYSSESDDDAPGEVSSSTARSTQLSQVRSDRQRDKEAKEKVREKRRNRNEMFTSQKKQKLETFEGRALPDDVLEAVSSKNKSDEEVGDEFDLGSDSGGDSEGESGSDSGDEDGDDSSDDEFIALDPSAKKDALNVVTVEAPKKNKSSLEKALAFRTHRLYSGPNAPNRCSANKRKGLIEKKRILQMK